MTALGIPPRLLWPTAVILIACSMARLAAADALTALPEPWARQLEPVAEADLSGAEPVMRRALQDARTAVARLLEDPRSPPAELARAYGRLGARLLLVEVETQADAALRNAMTLDPEELRWPYYAGYMATLAGNLDRALAYLERAEAIDPDYPTLALRLGKVRLDRGELEAARAAFARAAATPELRSPAQYYLGQVALLQRRFDDAVALLEDALEANPAATEAHYPLARAYQALGRDAEAKAHLQRFELRSPVIADPLLDELKASTQRALPSFERALHAVRKGDYRAAVDHFAAGLGIDPHNAAARVSYARVLYLTKQPAAAKQALEQALTDAARDPTSAAMAHFFAGVLEQAAGARDAAATAYRHALEQAPEHAGALFQLANLAFEQGHYAAAARRYEAALEADPDASPARLLALVAQARSGRSEAELIERLEALRATAPDDRLLAYALARLLAAAADETVRDPETAMAIAAELATSQPIPPHQRLVALADAARGRPDRAAKALASLREHAGWMLPPAERELLEEERAAYRDGRLPQPAWPDADPLLAPRPFDAARIMRDYPAAKPF